MGMQSPRADERSPQGVLHRPIRAGAVALTVVAALLVTLILLPWRSFGPFAEASASPTGSVEATTPSPTAVATSTTAPPASSTPAPTPVAAWTALSWQRADVSVTCDGCVVLMNDVIAWQGRYIGVGGVFYYDSDPNGYHIDLNAFSAAFLTSTDGIEWSIADQGNLVDFQEYEGIEDYGGVLETAVPRHLIALPGDLLAIGGDHPKWGTPGLWSSHDGTTWTVIDSPDWRAGWGSSAPDFGGLTTLVDVAGGGSGAVAIGFDGGGCCLTPIGPPVITYSADGLAWERLDPPSMGDRAALFDVVAHDGGFVIVGSTRGPASTEPSAGWEVGQPAAWTSDDGRTWSAADVEGLSVPGGRLTQVAVAADGFFAIGVAREPEYQWQASGWASADGRTWQLLGELGVGLPVARVIASDGVRITALGPATLHSLELAAWWSTDGAVWIPLTLTGTTQLPNGDTRYLNPDGTEEWTTGMTAVTDVWAVPGGVIVAQPNPAPVGGQTIWFASPVAP
jgi:hypothetical protein